jgi:hypothetical protein
MHYVCSLLRQTQNGTLNLKKDQEQFGERWIRIWTYKLNSLKMQLLIIQRIFLSHINVLLLQFTMKHLGFVDIIRKISNPR